jgi:hypothetical protein
MIVLGQVIEEYRVHSRSIYKHVVPYVEICTECQMFSNVRHRDELHLTYPLSMHYKWMVHIVLMALG